MLSIPDMALLGAAALLLFGPEQLPRVARKAGNVMREIQNTSSSFIREMERAADLAEAPRPSVYDPVVPYEPPAPFEPPAPDPAPYDVLHEWQTGPPVGEKLAEPGDALDRAENEGLHAAETGAHGGEPGLHAAEPVPERDHTPHV
jgi:sec-independent protein translocase protein TatA